MSNAVKHCAECGAPVVAGRSDCWSCLRPLAAPPTSAAVAASAAAVAVVPPPPAVTAPGVYRVCARCGLSTPRYHPACTGCGMPFGPDPLPLTAALPSGWVALEEADGTFVLTPTKWRRIFFTGAQLPGWLVFVMMLMALAGWSVFGYQRLPVVQWLRLLSYVVFLLAVIGSLLVVIFRETRWRVGSDYLETHYSLFGRSWGKRHQAGALSIRFNYADLGRGKSRELVVRSGAGKEMLMVGNSWYRQDLVSMGEFLAGVTGWSFDDRAPYYGLGMGGGMYS